MPGAAARPRDAVELAILGAFALVSVWVLAVDVWQVVAHGRTWTGSDGVYPVDQFQYMAWIRDASHHLLVSNLFVLHRTPADYLQPAIALSGGLTALGVAPWLSLLAWKPVAVLACFLAVRSFVHASLTARGSRRCALGLALFFGSFTVLGGSVTVLGDLFPGFLAWGYTFGLLALAAMVAALSSYASSESGSRLPWTAGALGLLASWLHPWNGELLVLVLAGAELTRAGRVPWSRRRLLRLAVTIVPTAAPLLYYALLGRLDPSWLLARQASKHAFPLPAILLAIAPLALVALPAYRRPARDLPAAAARAWPPAALLIYGLSGSALSATPLHAFQGITVPLAVLAVEGWRGLRLRPGHLVTLALLALFTVPATVVELSDAQELARPLSGDANFIRPGEQAALASLAADPLEGGVLARSYLGALVPEATGRHTFVGDCLWSEPHCSARLVAVRRLFAGDMPAQEARRFVRGTGARFLLADCRGGADLPRLLGSLIARERRFGCATVLAVSPTR